MVTDTTLDTPLIDTGLTRIVGRLSVAKCLHKGHGGIVHPFPIVIRWIHTERPTNVPTFLCQ